MAAKTANVLARVEPDVKAQAEEILAKLGVPASTVINMLYRQIIMTRGIPFSLSVPAQLPARDELDDASFDAMMAEGLAQAKAGKGIPLKEAFCTLRESL